MPRRANDVVHLPLPSKKKLKVTDAPPPPSLDASFADSEALTPGIVFSDVRENKWRIGKPIGRGSFGRIYLASDDIDKDVTKANAHYVVKIEPHTNGPLFVEVHCLIRTAQTGKIKAWRQRNKLKHIGMPVYIASGSFTDENTGTKYRFLVLPRYDIDLQKVIARTKVLDLKNVLVLAIQILDVLEYLHNDGYTHSDIKSSNLMLGFDGGRAHKVAAVKTPSFQKEIKVVAVLSGKQRRPKSAKSRSYYEDEDFIVKDYRSGDNSEDDGESDKRLENVKRKLRKMLTDKDSRTLHRHHAFNLRQLSNCVNYEDLNSSVCSDQSYQKLLDDFGTKQLVRASDEFNDKANIDGKFKTGFETNSPEVHKEAVLSQSNGQIYLLDYGLASKFLDSDGNHKDFGMDARKAHDGTLEYSSRDSHIGAHSRRSDLETLGYNLLDWLTGSLPWKTQEVLAEPDLVHALKKNFMNDVKSLIKTCFKGDYYPMFMEKYLEYVTNLDFTEKPDYDYCRSLFKSELLKNGYAKDICLNFAETLMPPMCRKLCYSKRFGRKNTPADFIARNGIVKKAYERENVCSIENNLKLELMKQTLNSSSDGIRKPCTSRNFFISDADLVTRIKKYLMPYDVLGKKLSPKNLRSKKNKGPKRRGRRRQRNSIGKFGNFMGSSRQFSWAEILAGNPEDIIRKERNTIEVETEDDEEECKYRIRKLSNASSIESVDNNLQSPLMQKDYLQNANPTYAMKEVLANFNKKVSRKSLKEPEEFIGLEGYTPAMIKVFRMKEKRLEDLKQQNLTKKETVMVAPRCTRSTKAKTAQPKVTTRQTRQKSGIESEEKTNIGTNTDKPIKTNPRTSNKEKNNVIIKEKVEVEKPIKINEIKTTRLTRSNAEKQEKLSIENPKKFKEKKSQLTRQKHSNDIKKDNNDIDHSKASKLEASTMIAKQSTVLIEKMDIDITPYNRATRSKVNRNIEKMDADIASNNRTRSQLNKKVTKQEAIAEKKPASVTKKSSPKTSVAVPSNTKILRSGKLIQTRRV